MLFTVALLLLVPPSWDNAQAGHDKTALASMGSQLASYAILLGQFGVADLAVIIASLIIIWKGYYRKSRWAWCVMAVIVWAWYFPQWVLPSLRYLRGFDVYKWLLSWLDVSSWHYGPPDWIWILLLMLAALLLPVRSFFFKASESPRSDEQKI